MAARRPAPLRRFCDGEWRLADASLDLPDDMRRGVFLAGAFGALQQQLGGPEALIRAATADREDGARDAWHQ